jgi:cytochrome P450
MVHAQESAADRSDIRDLAKRTVDRLIAAGPEADFVPLVSAPYPLHVVMQILGVPEEDEPRMLFLTQQMFGGQDEDLNKTGMANLSPEQITQIVLGAVKDFTAYFEKLAEERRRNPGKDVATILGHCDDRWPAFRAARPRGILYHRRRGRA